VSTPAVDPGGSGEPPQACGKAAEGGRQIRRKRASARSKQEPRCWLRRGGWFRIDCGVDARGTGAAQYVPHAYREQVLGANRASAVLLPRGSAPCSDRSEQGASLSKLALHAVGTKPGRLDAIEGTFRVPFEIHMSSETCSLRDSALELRRRRIGSYLLQTVAAVILAQTLFFKFSGAPEPVHIFTTLGVEPWGRLATALVETLTVVLLLVSRTAVMGALLGAGSMLGAIGAHLGPLGIEVLGDHGLLFGLAVITLLACCGVLWLRRDQALVMLAMVRR